MPGAYGKTYRQTVGFNETKPLKAACSCPYDKGGICKHAVAALRELAAMGDAATDRCFLQNRAFGDATKSEKDKAASGSQ